MQLKFVSGVVFETWKYYMWPKSVKIYYNVIDICKKKINIYIYNIYI